MLLPKVKRKQISYRKFNRMAKSPDSKRVRVFLWLQPYKINTTVRAFISADGLVYVEQMLWQTDRYKTFHFRYEWNEAVHIVGKQR